VQPVPLLLNPCLLLEGLLPQVGSLFIVITLSVLLFVPDPAGTQTCMLSWHTLKQLDAPLCRMISAVGGRIGAKYKQRSGVLQQGCAAWGNAAAYHPCLLLEGRCHT
jgi:hypothetical protein